MRTKWLRVYIPTNETGDVTVKELKDFLAAHPDLPDGALVSEDNPCCGGSLGVEWRAPWTAEDHAAEADRLAAIEAEEAEDRKAGF